MEEPEPQAPAYQPEPAASHVPDDTYEEVETIDTRPEPEQDDLYENVEDVQPQQQVGHRDQAEFCGSCLQSYAFDV